MSPTNDMSSNPLSDAVEPDIQTVFDVLTSEQCRRVLQSLDSPMSATEIADECGLPRSTVYRKLQQMVGAGLLEKFDTQHGATRYYLGFDEVVVTTTGGELEVAVTSEATSASDQLSKLWSDVRTEATNR
ncbi:helix-turn-helix domain-containing protein [Haloferax sp. DFSO52]|uniref:helix-turn-helix domain-containing protein n=1 Tax=Haloferax sp. DFSO52 TaxID=3388505 RepID=UPI003A879470